MGSIGFCERRERLQHPAAADELFDIVELGRQEVGEVLVSGLGDDDDILRGASRAFVCCFPLSRRTTDRPMETPPEIV